MSKNWLIRTKTNHILGPISKEKVLELLQNGSIKGDDEVCSGNGFWFYIREDDMVARFLLGREQQTFNPISEAKDVLTSPPRSGQHDDDITLVGGIDLKSLKERTPPTGTYVTPLKMNELKGPPAPDTKKKVELVRATPEPEREPRKPHQRVLKPKGEKAPLKKQNYLQYLALICFLILLAALWYRRSLFRYLKADGVGFVFIEKVYAQESPPAEKKK
jgi:hypothetical protein